MDTVTFTLPNGESVTLSMSDWTTVEWQKLNRPSDSVETILRRMGVRFSQEGSSVRQA